MIFWGYQALDAELADFPVFVENEARRLAHVGANFAPAGQTAEPLQARLLGVFFELLELIFSLAELIGHGVCGVCAFDVLAASHGEHGLGRGDDLAKGRHLVV